MHDTFWGTPRLGSEFRGGGRRNRDSGLPRFEKESRCDERLHTVRFQRNDLEQMARPPGALNLEGHFNG